MCWTAVDRSCDLGMIWKGLLPRSSKRFDNLRQLPQPAPIMSTDTSSSPAEASSSSRRKWHVGLYECYSYKDRSGFPRWNPDFCFHSLICSNVMIGKIYSQLYKEEMLCNQLGPVGGLLCIGLIPLSMYSPIGGVLCYGALANVLRHRVLDLYEVQEDPVRCCLLLDPCLTCTYYGCNYPCSLFQMKISMDEWDLEEASKLPPSIAMTTPAQW